MTAVVHAVALLFSLSLPRRPTSDIGHLGPLEHDWLTANRRPNSDAVILNHLVSNDGTMDSRGVFKVTSQFSKNT